MTARERIAFVIVAAVFVAFVTTIGFASLLVVIALAQTLSEGF